MKTTHCLARWWRNSLQELAEMARSFPYDLHQIRSLLRRCQQDAVKTSMDVAQVCYDLDVPITVLLCTDDPMLEMLQGMAINLKRPR